MTAGVSFELPKCVFPFRDCRNCRFIVAVFAATYPAFFVLEAASDSEAKQLLHGIFPRLWVDRNMRNALDFLSHLVKRG